MGILGEDGDGYELAVRLENSAAWREWLGAASYAKLLPHLSSPAAWHSLMNSSSALLTLQMRVRALLFDKATGCLFLTDNTNNANIAPSSLHPSFLQLDSNGVYFLLEEDAEDWKRLRVDGSPIIATLHVKHDLHPLDSSTGNGDDGPDAKGASIPVMLQRQTQQAGQHFPNLISPKQEVSRPSLTKVKKVEAWDNFDAKRPMEMVGTINKKLRSPKISSKASFQGDPIPNSSTRDHHPDKMANTKTLPGSALMLEEPKYSAIGAGRAGHTEGAESGGLWYDRSLEKHALERMQRVAHRSAQQKLPFKDQEACLRTPEAMASYIHQLSCSNGKLAVGRLSADFNTRMPNYISQKLVSEDGNKLKDDSMVMQEFKFLGNSVPDNPVPVGKRQRLNNHTVCRGLLDQLHPPSGNSSYGVGGSQRPGVHTELDSTANHEADRLSGSSMSVQCLSKVHEQDAQQMMQQTIAKVVAGAGFEGLKQASLDILCDVLGRHIRKLGSQLKLFVDNYCKHVSQTEILKMCIQSTGSSVEDLMEHVKVGLEVGSQAVTPVSSLGSSPQLSIQKRRPAPTQVPSQQMSPRQSPSAISPLQQAQQPFSDKALKRRQPSNLGRSKKVEKDRPVSDGKSGEARSDVSRPMREMKPTQQISPRLHPQQAPWHPQIPLIVQPQPGSVLQNYKQQLSSLQQLPSLQQ